jgi:hypothetical protein
MKNDGPKVNAPKAEKPGQVGAMEPAALAHLFQLGSRR